MYFVIIHGSFGHSEEHWIPQLKNSLLALNQKVITPNFPCDSFEEITKSGPKEPSKKQTLTNWFNLFEKEVLPQIKNKKVCLVGHSLGSLFILHLLEKFKLNIDSAIFVSPFLQDPQKDSGNTEFWQFKKVNQTFYKDTFDFPKLTKLIKKSYVLYSRSDPYLKQKVFEDFAEMIGSPTINVRGAGHFNSDNNLNEFPLILELCKSRLDLSLYQKYIAHRKELYSVDYIHPSEEVIFLKPNEYYDEGIFHFRNLQKHGFCTLLTSLTIWEEQSAYMQSCRRSAQRMGNLTRVYVIDNLDDFKRKDLKFQLDLDISSKVQVYFVMRKDVEHITDDLDFGLWDYEYVCTVEGNKGKLSSRKKDIQQGQKWEKQILKESTQINSSNDFFDFIKSHN